MNTMRKEMDKAREENRTEQSEREEELSIYSISIWFFLCLLVRCFKDVRA